MNPSINSPTICGARPGAAVADPGFDPDLRRPSMAPSLRLVLAVTVLTLGAARAADPPPAERVLFIGNSFTQGLFTQLPKLLKSAQPAPALTVDLAAAGGVTLEQHYDPQSDTNKSAHTRQKLANGHWDLVVLQEYSSRPIETSTKGGQPSGHDLFLKYGALFDAAIKQAGARTALYMTWARQPEPDNFAKLAAAYRELGQRIGAPCAPVGLALQSAIADLPDVKFYAADQKHLVDAGYYVGACVFYGFLTQQSPVGLKYHPAKLSDEAAAKIQALAWQAVQQEPMPSKQP
jgi:hypothetical protein